MANVRINLPDGREIDVEESLLADPEVNQQFQDLYDTSSGDIGLLENVGEKVKDFGRGVLQNVSGLSKHIAIKAKQVDQDLPEWMQSYKGKETKELQTYKIGEWLDKVIPKTDARVRDTFPAQVATGLGQVAGAVGTGIATGGSSAAGQLIVSAIPAVGMQSAEDFERAKRKGATEEQAQTAANWGGVWGATDVLPFGNALNILKKAVPGWKGLAKEAVQQLILEGGQEGMQQALSNATAQLTYDEKQKIMEDVLPSAEVGGVVGAISGTILHALGAKGKVKIGPTTQPEQTEANPATAMEAIEALRARGIGKTAIETTNSAEAESVELEPTTIDTIQANEAGELTPSQAFAKQMMDAGKTDSEIHTDLTLLNVIAQTRGMDLDTFVEKAIAGVQSGEASPAEGDVLNQAGAQAQPFFSKLESVVQEKMPNRMKTTDLYNFLAGKVSQEEQEVVLAEIGNNAVVSKTQVLEAIKAASVQTEDVVLGKDDAQLKVTFLSSGEYKVDNGQGEWINVLADNEQDAIQQAQEIAGTAFDQTMGVRTQFSSYQLPGAVEGSYREMFVTTPNRGDLAELLEKAKSIMLSEEELQRGEALQKEQGILTTWKDGHTEYSSIQNPIVRIRYNERIVEGKRILFVEEMQGPSDSEQQKMPSYLRKRIYDIGTKRVLALAKEQGFDGVAWTTGEQQAKRYDLSKHVKSIGWLKNDTEQTVMYDVTTHDGDIQTRDASYKALENHLGKELAHKILASEKTSDTFTDLDLKVGGEGLKDTYNKRIPSLMKKYGKGSVENLKIGNSEFGGFPTNALESEYDILYSISEHAILSERQEARYNELQKLYIPKAVNVSYTPITPQTPSTFSLFQALRPKNGQSTSDIKGSVNFLEDGRAVITLMQGSDQSTMLHEIGHILRRWLNPEEQVTANEFVGATSSDWTTAQEEMWARGWERYLRRGKAPNDYLKTVFEKMRTWLRRIYKTVKGSEIDVRLDPKTIALFDKILTPAELPSQKAPWAMPFEAWKTVYGEDEAAMYGLTKKSVSVRKVSRFNSLVNAISGKGARGVLFARYLTPNETEQQLAIVSDPTYLQQPLANRNIDEYIVRVLNLFATRANSSFHLGEPIQPILEELQAQIESADRKGLFEQDPGHGYVDESFTGFVTRRMSFEDTIKFVSNLAEVQKIRESWDTPVRQQLLAIKRDIYHNTQDVVMDRVTGQIYAIETRGLHSASMIDVDRGDIRRVPISDLNTQFIWPELLSDDTNATLTKEEWMAEKHYEMVLDALEKGEAVPSWNIAQHLTKDPTLQEAFDKAKLAEDSTDGTIAQSNAVTELFQEQQGVVEEPEIVEPIHVGAAPSATLEDLEQIGRIVTESYRELTRLANVLDQQDGPRLIGLIKKEELQKLARKIGAISDVSSEQYIADLFIELDEYKQVLETQANEMEFGGINAMAARVGTIYQTLRRFTESIENSGQSRLLDEEPTVNQVRRLNHWAQRNLLHKEPGIESAVGQLMERAIFTMQGLSWRHPILKPLFKLWIHQNNQATKMSHDLFYGKPELETLSFQNAKGSTDVTLKASGLRTLKSMATNSPAYDAMRSLVLVGDRMHTQFSLEECMLGLEDRLTVLDEQAQIEILELQARGITEEQEIIQQSEAVKKVIAIKALDQILSTRSVEERKQAATAYFEIQDTLKYMFFKTKKVLNDMLGKAGEDVLKQIAPRGFIPGYFPHMRIGKFGVLVKGADGKTKYFQTFEDHVSQFNSLKELRAKYPQDTVVPVDTTQKLEYHIGGGQDLIDALQDVIGKTKLNEVIEDKDALEIVQKMLLETTGEMVKAHGIFSMFKERQDIPGFDERISMIMHKRVTDFSSAIAKIEFAQRGAKEISGLRSMSNLHNYAKEWFGAMLEGADANDVWIGRIRAGIYIKYLGFNMKTALVMVADKLTNAPSVLGRYTSNPDKKIMSAIGDTVRFKSWLHSVEKVMNASGISRSEAIEQTGLPEGFDAETTNAMLWSLDSGATLAKFVPEVFSHESMSWEAGRSGQSSFGKALDNTKFVLGKTFDYAAWMGSKMEELNKLSTFLSAYRVFRREKGWSFDRATDVAQDVVNDAHVVYGRGNIPLPLLRKGIWKWARLGYVFKSFDHHYIQMMLNMGTLEGKRGKQMATRSMAALVALAGVPALPFFTGLAKLWGMYTGDDPEQFFRRTLTRVTGSAWAAKLFSDGLPSVANVTLRGSLGVGAYESWEDIIAGVAGSSARDIGRGFHQAVTNDWDGFAKTIMPTVLSNIYKAQQGSQTGVMTAKGGPRRENGYGDVIKYSGFERLAKTASFAIEREARAQRLDMALKREDDYWQGKRSAIYTKFAKGARMEDKAYIQSALVEAVEYEKERVSRRALDVTPISRTALKQSLTESGLKKKNILHVMRVTGQLPN